MLENHNPYKISHDTLLAVLKKTEADNEPLAISKVLEITGIYHALWCIDLMWPEKLRIKLNCRFANEFERWMPQNIRDALFVMERYADGTTSEEAFQAAAVAARNAAARIAADRALRYTAAYYAARAVVRAAHTSTASYAIASYADAAETTADTAAADAADEAARANQTEILRDFLAKMEGCAT